MARYVDTALWARQSVTAAPSGDDDAEMEEIEI
jgi:hypothetical protein